MEIILCSDFTYYIINDFIYVKDSIARGVTYLTCRIKACNGTARFSHPENPIVGRRHGHTSDPSEVNKLKLKGRLVTRAVSELTPLRQIYETEILRHPLGAVVYGYPSARATMKRCANVSRPRKPITLLDQQIILTDPAFTAWRKAYNSEAHFFRRSAMADDGSQLSLCIGEEFIPFLQTRDVTLMIDGTFKTVPRHCGAVQLVTIHAVVRELEEPEVYPCAYILMTNKTQEAYECAFRNLSAEVGGMQPGRVMCDFEASMRAALQAVFVGVDVDGCWFHHSQAVLNESHEYGLTPILQNSEEANIALRRIMALPLLPPDEHIILEALSGVEDYLQENNLLLQFQNFLGYFRRQWINTVPPRNWSVYLQDIRTNNIVERYHLTLLTSTSDTTHPEFWPFYNTLRRLNFTYVVSRQQRLNGIRVNTNIRKRKYRIFNGNLRNMWTALQSGELNLNDFVRRAGHLCSGLQRRLSRTNRRRLNQHAPVNQQEQVGNNQPALHQDPPQAAVNENDIADALNIIAVALQQ